MKKIAFDLDGVLVPDCDQIPHIGGLEDYYNLTLFMRPIFRPKYPWNIITGRSYIYKHLTLLWINKYFDIKPSNIWHEHDKIKLSTNEYKAYIINNEKIDLYIESDYSIVTYLRQHTGSEIIHFSQFLEMNLNDR